MCKTKCVHKCGRKIGGDTGARTQIEFGSSILQIFMKKGQFLLHYYLFLLKLKLKQRLYFICHPLH